ncbi:MAG: MmgE/PrpD family protein [Burkholderiales bacterium]
MKDYIDALADFALGTRYEDIPPAVIEHAKLILSDTLPVIASGMQESEMRSLVARHLPKASPGQANVVGTGKRAGPLDAAMLNAMAGVWNELDEGHFYTNGHPGIHVIPAALAHAQEHGLSGKDLLAAIVMGYEVAGRIGGAYRMRVIVQTHGTFGVNGSTVAVGRMSGLTHKEMREAINIAASTPLGGNRVTMTEGTTVRNYYPGHANFTGQMAVRLAQSGFTAPKDSPSVTFGQILADDFKPEKAAARLGDWWLITENYIKLYPSARYVHCAIDALLNAISKAPGRTVDPVRVDHVEVYGYRMLVFCGNPKPTSMFGTHFSTPFSMATILVHGRNDLDVFGEAAFKNPAVMELASRVQMIEIPEMNANFPTEIPARVKIVMKDGASYEGSVSVPKGERGNQHSAEELERKFFQLASPVWGDQLSRTVRESCLSIDRLENVRDLAGGTAL